MAELPKAYAWLASEPGPRLLLEALKTFGTVEAAGTADNPTIISWGKSIGYGAIYKDDATPWCGLAMAYWARQAGWDMPVNPLWARNWLDWGARVEVPNLGDVLVFSRGPSSGHVGLYVGEDDTAYHVLGGNQGNSVSIKRIAKKRLIGSRRCKWRINQPANVRRIYLSNSGALSDNEA